MIEVNLIPGGKKRRQRRSLSLPSFGGGGDGVDRWLLGAVGVWLLALLYVIPTYTGKTSQLEELDVRLEVALEDSARFAAQSARIATLRARRDSINERIALIQQIDQDRYIWAHVMDEVARALPDFTWLTTITATSPEPNPSMNIEGYAGTQFALSSFLSNLEASPFLERVDLVSADAEALGAAGDVVQRFVFEATYVQPPFEQLQSVPLFEDGPAPATNPLDVATDTASAATGGGE